MLIEVTQERIQVGDRGECLSCPVALAMCAAGLADVIVSETQFIFVHNRVRYVQSVPHEVNRKIIKFDEHGVMEPFEFELSLPA